MTDLDEDVLYEAVELSKAVFSSTENTFERDYDGDVEEYMLVEDMRNRIEIATLDSGGMIYPEKLPDFEELGGKEALKAFYSIRQGEEVDVPEVFYEEGLVEGSENGVFYGENALPYLLVIDEAERIHAPQKLDSEVLKPEHDDQELLDAELVESESYSDTESDELNSKSPRDEVEQSSQEPEEENNADNNEVDEEEESDKVEELSEIWDNVTGSGS